MALPSLAKPDRLEIGDGDGALIDEGKVRVFGSSVTDVHDSVPRTRTLRGIDDAIQLATTQPVVCILRASGAVLCAAEDGSRVEVPIPPAQWITTSQFETCAVTREGTVWCWDASARAQRRGVLPRRIEGLDGVHSLATTSSWGCALLRDGRVRCLARAMPSSAPQGATGREAPAMDMPLRDVVQIESAERAMCALVRDGTAHCWGAPRGEDILDVAPIQVADVDGIVSLHGGNDVMCARRRDGTVACWGDGEHGLLGTGNIRSAPEPVLAPLYRDAMELELTQSQACTLSAAGRVACIGTNHWGALGVEPRRDAVLAIPEVRARWVSTGEHWTCAGDESVWCWGTDSFDPIDPARETPEIVPIPNASMVREVWASLWKACVLYEDGALDCFDGWREGALVSKWRSDSVVDITGSGEIVCALWHTGTMACGPLGTQLVAVPESPFTVIAQSNGRACGAKADGRVFCWDVIPRQTHAPRLIATVPGLVDLAVGLSIDCMRRDERLLCARARSGDSPSGTADEIAAKDALVCAREGGRARCWGYRDAAQIKFDSGRPHPDATHTPTTLSGVDDLTSISVGGEHVCGVRADRTVACWATTLGHAVGRVPSWLHLQPIEIVPEH
jgi:hypothetical protein